MGIDHCYRRIHAVPSAGGADGDGYAHQKCNRVNGELNDACIRHAVKPAKGRVEHHDRAKHDYECPWRYAEDRLGDGLARIAQDVAHQHGTPAECHEHAIDGAKGLARVAIGPVAMAEEFRR